MKNYRVGFKEGGTQLTPEQIKRKKDHWKRNWKRKGPLPKPGPKPGTGLKDLEKLKKGREGREAPKAGPYRPYPREGREAPKVKPDPYRRGWEKLPQIEKYKNLPKWKKPIDKFPGDPKKYTKPIDKFPADPKKWQPMKEGGRTGLKKGGPKPGTHDYFLLHKREKKAGGGTLLKQTVKKVAKKIKAKKDTESVKDVR